MKKLTHLAIILDGNGRWAKAQGKDRTFGHKQGMEKIFDTILWAKEHEIKFLTLFCFSTENWNRPKSEVNYLMRFPGEIFNDKAIKKYQENDIKINWIGRRTKVPSKTKKALENVEEKTRQQKSIVVNLALDYGSQEEITQAVQAIIKTCQAGEKTVDEIDFQLLYNNLYTNNQPPVDLLIRTGGEQRLSNFLLLQLGYAELYFTKVFWPDFTQSDLTLAITSYYQRDRRFGRIEE